MHEKNFHMHYQNFTCLSKSSHAWKKDFTCITKISHAYQKVHMHVKLSKTSHACESLRISHGSMFSHTFHMPFTWFSHTYTPSSDFALKRVRVWRPWQHTPTQTSLQVPPPPHGNVYHTKKKHILQLTTLVSPIVIDKIAAHWNCHTWGTWANLYKVRHILCRRCLLKLDIHFLILYNNNY